MASFSLRAYRTRGRWTAMTLFVAVWLREGVVTESVKRRPLHRELNLDDLIYVEYPRRTEDEAAVLEWGHSAIISALDASVARFGPQTSEAALLEVECMPILGSPLNGVREERAVVEEMSIEGDGRETEEAAQSNIARSPSSARKKVLPLDNAHEVHGNMVVMTNTGKLSGVHMAKIAKASGAAALLVVNVDDKRPDDIYRLDIEEGDEDANEIDIPVVMISMNSANVLTSATVTPGMPAEDIVNHGMPERVRLYAGGDRPFFEDVEPQSPTLYLIHNLLTANECDMLIAAAQSRVAPVTSDDTLQMTYAASDLDNRVERVMLWQGLLQSPAKKVVEERIEQVTGFPATHYSDFIVDRIDPGGQWKAHYDFKEGAVTPMASITIYLSHDGGALVYPMAKEPVKISARKGAAVVHHNTNERHQLDQHTLHALMPSNRPVYVARKYVYTAPVSMARRLALPLIAAPFGGKLPSVIVQVHDALVEKVGPEKGGFYFDKLCVFIPLLVGLGIAHLLVTVVHQKLRDKKREKTSMISLQKVATKKSSKQNKDD